LADFEKDNSDMRSQHTTKSKKSEVQWKEETRDSALIVIQWIGALGTSTFYP